MTKKEGSPVQLGWVWGQIYIVVTIVISILSIVWSSMFLANMPLGWIGQFSTTQVIISLIVSVLWLVGALGLWGRRRWGLWLTCLLLVASALFTIYQAVALFANGLAVETTHLLLTAQIIVWAIQLLVICLYLGYFIRRRLWFR